MAIARLVVFLLLCLAAVAPSAQSQDLCSLDKSKMVPLRDAVHRAYQYSLSLKGSAITGAEPYEIHFDTGSWTTSIPGGALDFSQIQVIRQDVTTDWGRPADLVEGQLAVESSDGTVYSIDDFRFYALKESLGGAYLPDDRTAPYGSGIMGAFPSPYPYRDEQSFPFLLAKKYAADRMGLGIVSSCIPDASLSSGWSLLDSYLQIGRTSEITDHLVWRSDVPKWITQPGFYPEAAPGFRISIDFPDTDARIVTADELVATVDTGAPDLTLRLNSNDPQYSSALASHFVKDGPWVNWNDDYRSHASTLVNGTVTVSFTDDLGSEHTYSYYVGSDPYEAYTTPASLFAGQWSGNVPWRQSVPSFPKTRINLGNSLYYFWPVYYWDIENERVGIGTSPAKGTSVEPGPGFELAGTSSFPNPFSRTTTIRFELAKASDVHLTIHDVLGREVTVLASDSYSAGKSEVSWDAGTLPDGIYMYRLTTNAGSTVGRMVLAR